MAWEQLSEAQREILRRYHAIVQEWNKNAASMADLQQAQAALSQQANDFMAAGRVFGFDLATEYQTYAVQLANVTATQFHPEITGTKPQAVAATEIPVPRPRTVRDMVLEAAEKAYPKPVRARELRDQLAKQGISLHEKTVGMTLYRLSRDDRSIKRVGKANWFFVPEAVRRKPSATEERESPADEAGLLEEAMD